MLICCVKAEKGFSENFNTLIEFRQRDVMYEQRQVSISHTSFFEAVESNELKWDARSLKKLIPMLVPHPFFIPDFTSS